MCGIAGRFAYRPGARAGDDRARLERVRDAMARRGPDGTGYWECADGRAAFGHRRLAIIGLGEGGAQPMTGATRRCTIVINGEIYNYASLRAELESDGVRFRGASDTEVVLALYERDGAAMLERLRGMFALAIWDATKGELFLARDPYGIKPLYLADTGRTLWFASQVRALAAHAPISRDPDPAGLAGFHIFGHVPEPFTIHRAIRALPAGCWCVANESGLSAPVRYASIAATIVEGRGVPIGDRAEYARAALFDSVKAHLVADVEVGAFLSGGVDSGAIVGLMRDAGASRITAATLRFEEFAGTERDETPLAAAVARQYGVTHHVRTIGAQEFAEDRPAIDAAMDQPSIDGVNSWFVSKAIGELGLKVALSGLGGDELLRGYATFDTVPALRRRLGLVASVPGMGRLWRAIVHTALPRLLRDNPKVAGLLDLPASWGGAYLLRRAVLLPFELDRAMDPAMARQGLAELEPVLLANNMLDPDPGSDTGRVAALESQLYMRNQLLRDTDWASMAHGVEARVPLVDFTLLKAMAPFMAGLAPGDGKMLLGNAPSMPLPDAVMTKPKTGFSIPVARWQGGAATPARTDSRAIARAVLDRFARANRLVA